MGNPPRGLVIATCVVALLTILCAGCSARQVTYVDAGRSYDSTMALDVLDRTESPVVAAQATAAGPELRTKALAQLTRQGDTASEVAALLIRSFPSGTAGVPIYVERVTFSGKPAVLVVEAVGREGGSLSYRRLWVVGTTGEVLFAGSR